MRSITIGRDNTCDIVLNNPRISRMHGVITLKNGNYSYRDNSANGTVINGVLVKKSEINIKIGDSIMLASDEPIPWHKITNLLPIEKEPIATTPSEEEYDLEPERIGKWSWGGFFFGWLWAVTHRIYWPLIVFIPYLGWLSIIIVNIILGVNGNKWAWESEEWESIETFDRVQYTWSRAAAITAIMMLVAIIIGIIASIAFAGTIAAMFF